MTPMYGVNKVGEEGFDFGCAHGGGVTQFVEADKTHVLVEIGFLGADGVPARRIASRRRSASFFSGMVVFFLTAFILSCTIKMNKEVCNHLC